MGPGAGAGRGTGRGRIFPAPPALKRVLKPAFEDVVGGRSVVRGASVGVRIPDVGAGALGAGLEPRGAELAWAPPAECPPSKCPLPPKWPPPPKPPACAPPPCCANATGACRHTATSKQTSPTRIFQVAATFMWPDSLPRTLRAMWIPSLPPAAAGSQVRADQSILFG